MCNQPSLFFFSALGTLPEVISVLRDYDNSQDPPGTRVGWLIDTYNARFPQQPVDDDGKRKAQVILSLPKDKGNPLFQHIPRKGDPSPESDPSQPDINQKVGSIFFGSGANRKKPVSSLRPFSSEKMNSTFKACRKNLNISKAPNVANLSWDQLSLFKKLNIEPKQLAASEDFDLSSLEEPPAYLIPLQPINASKQGKDGTAVFHELGIQHLIDNKEHYYKADSKLPERMKKFMTQKVERTDCLLPGPHTYVWETLQRLVCLLDTQIKLSAPLLLALQAGLEGKDAESYNYLSQQILRCNGFFYDELDHLLGLKESLQGKDAISHTHFKFERELAVQRKKQAPIKTKVPSLWSKYTKAPEKQVSYNKVCLDAAQAALVKLVNINSRVNFSSNFKNLVKNKSRLLQTGRGRGRGRGRDRGRGKNREKNRNRRRNRNKDKRKNDTKSDNPAKRTKTETS